MSQTTVVHISQPYDVYIGRGKKGEIPDPPEYGCFGNPIPLVRKWDKQERSKCVGEFKVYFDRRILHDPIFKAAILKLKGRRLGCFCKKGDPNEICHGDVIVRYLDDKNNSDAI